MALNWQAGFCVTLPYTHMSLRPHAPRSPCPSVAPSVFFYLKTKDGYVSQQVIQPPMTVEQWGYTRFTFVTIWPMTVEPNFGYSVGLSHTGKVLVFGCVDRSTDLPALCRLSFPLSLTCRRPFSPNIATDGHTASPAPPLTRPPRSMTTMSKGRCMSTL